MEILLFINVILSIIKSLLDIYIKYKSDKDT